MVPILRMIGVLSLAAATAVLALSLREELSASYPRDIVTGPSIVEQFGLSDSATIAEGNDHVPPLLRQAQIFAQYLNPPIPPRQEVAALTSEPHTVPAPPVEVRPPSTTTQFELHGISYHPLRPEESMALIWEPGNGRQWVRRGDRLGHCTIAEIRSASIVYYSGEQRAEISLAPDQLVADSTEVESIAEPQTQPMPPSTRRARRTSASHFIARDGSDK